MGPYKYLKGKKKYKWKTEKKIKKKKKLTKPNAYCRGIAVFYTVHRKRKRQKD